MGRIKSAMIKKAARQLYSEVEGFSEDFDHNKDFYQIIILYCHKLNFHLYKIC